MSDDDNVTDLDEEREKRKTDKSKLAKISASVAEIVASTNIRFETNTSGKISVEASRENVKAEIKRETADDDFNFTLTTGKENLKDP